MSVRALTSFLLFGLLLLVAPARAQDTAQLVGEWKGAIEIPGMPLEVRIEIRAGEGGALSGAIDIPAQNARGLPLVDFALEDGRVRFRFEDLPGDPSFDGELAEGAARLNGTFTQSGLEFPFTLERVDREALLAAAREKLAGLDELMAEALKDWKTPGAALAIVTHDGVVLAQGFGQRDLEAELPVTADTLFAIGSTTKAFTCALLADLAEEGRVEWDAPVRQYLPRFELMDEYATLHMTVRDLVTHRSGLPRHDLAWYGSDATREELVQRLRYLESSEELRVRFQYQNLMYVTAGYLAGRVAGTTWEEELRARFLEPLGMTRSVLSVTAMQQDDDHALPYEEEKRKLKRIPFRDIDEVGPAGSIDSSAAEMARWLAFLLARGELDGRRILDESSFEELVTPAMVVPEGPQALEQTGQPTYALGWMVQTYRGHQRLHHGGGIDGFTALVTFLPRDGVGVVALANRSGSTVPSVATMWILDRLLELEPIDWTELMKPLVKAAEREEKQQKKKKGERREDTQPSHPLADYAGEFEHPGYGVASVTLAEDALRVQLNGVDAALEHWHFDTFRVEEGAGEGTLVQFHADRAGEVARLSAQLEPAVDEIVFERRPPAELSDPEFLARIAGRYSLAGASCTVSLRGEKLAVTVQGQPTYTLLPYRANEFRLEGLEGYLMRVELEEGRCVRVVFIQPNGTFSAKRIEEDQR